MLDIRTIRTDPDRVRTALKNRGTDIDVDALLELDEKRRSLLTEVDKLKNERNVASAEIGKVKKAGGDIAAPKEAMRKLGEQISAIDAEAKTVDESLRNLLLTIPNIPHETVPVGLDESANQEVKTWGEPRNFDFDPQSHIEIGERLGLFAFERAAKISGAGFPMLVGVGAKLQRALVRFMLDVQVDEHGYTELAPPYLVNAKAMTGTGQLPKLAEDMYHMEVDDLYLIPTAEVPVTNYFMGDIIQDGLPKKFTAYTPCFRREAGAAGRDTRGLIRVHQFDKVEMVKIVEPETSYDELESLLLNAEQILQKLNLPYRVLALCSGDLSFSAAKCYDIELWAPGQDDWLEVSSCSNFEDFQARRAQIRYRNAEGKTALVHTLNGSGVATPRLYVSILENGQQADGSVLLPEALWPYMDGQQQLTPP